MLRKLAAILLLLAMAPFSQADLVGHYILKEGRNLTLSYRDDQNIRVEMDGGHLLLVNGGKVLLVANQGGHRVALDMNQMGALLGGMAGPGNVNLPDAGSVSLKATGERAKVAGYEGEWYLIDDGEKQYRALLTTAQPVVQLTRAFAQIATRMSKLLGPQQASKLQQLMDDAMQKGPGGVLQQADALQLEQVQQRQLPDSTYQLPPGVPLLSLPMGLGRI